LYDPKGKGVLIDPQADAFDAAFARTQELLQSAQQIFEAGFRAEGALALADVMLPVRKNGKLACRMVEVKSSTSVKDYHRDDAAVQSFVARSSGAPLTKIALAHINSDWVYPGNEDHDGLLLENDLTDEVFGRGEEVRGWIAEAQLIVAKKREPRVATGKHCGNPYECGFLAYCLSQEPQAEQPIRWLPGRLSNELQAHTEAHGLTELRDVPDELLNEKQQRVKPVTLSGKPYFDQRATVATLAAHKLPLGLAQQGPRLYLVCRYRGYDNERSVALHRILSAEMSRLTFDRPKEFGLKKYDDDGRFGFGEGEKVQLTFRIERNAGFHLLESPLSSDQRVVELYDGRLEITASVIDSAMLEWWPRGFGDAIEVVRRRSIVAVKP
jgi:hypothetical protein